ncbi:MAG: hypothetical protein O9352_15110, partial [Rhizobium sp.]|nr:hypothetical protein [Rhizobium sp.]
MGGVILGGWPGDKRYLTQKVQHGVWYVTVDVPRPYQAALGRKRVLRSLKTRDLKTAQSLRWSAVAEIKAEVQRSVEAATGHPDANLTAWALEVREELRSVPAKAHDTREMVEEALSARVDEIASRLGPETAMQVHQIATGKADPITLQLDRYLDNSGLTARTKADVRTAVAEFEDWCQRRSKNRPGGGAKVGHLGPRMRPAGGRSPSGGLMRGRRFSERVSA